MAATVGVVFELTRPGGEDRFETAVGPLAIDVALSGVTFAFGGPLVIGVLRQLRMVDRIHDRAVRIDLFHPTPLYAFSRATATTGVLLAVIVSFSAFTDPASAESAAALTFSVLVIVLAGASFVLPLWGIHQRLAAERLRLVNEAGLRVQLVIARLYESVDRGESADGTREQLSALVSTRDMMVRLNTWPWQPDTPRWMLSAVVIPLALWGVTRLLERTGL